MLSDTEADALNTAVALAMGWKQRTDASGGYWILPDGGMDDAPPHGTDYEGKHYGDFHALPNFCRDAHSFGWLLSWIDSHKFGFEIKKRQWEADAVCTAELFDIRTHSQKWQFSGKGETPGEALSQAVISFSAFQALDVAGK